MLYYKLYTYSSIKELRKIQRLTKVIPFNFDKTKALLTANPNSCIDISALIYFLQSSKDQIYMASLIFQDITEETTILVHDSLANDTVNFFPYLFSEYIPFLEKDYTSHRETSPNVFRDIKQPIYVYNDTKILSNISSYADEHNISIFSFLSTLNNSINIFEKVDELELALVDLTSAAYVIEDNKNYIYLMELFMMQLSNAENVKIIILASQIDKLINYFPLYIKSTHPITELLSDMDEQTYVDSISSEVKKITSLSESQFESFINYFNSNLVGHKSFKNQLQDCLNKFIKLNKLKEQKVFSLFLFGSSGIGKTEVGRLIANGLLKDNHLAKINLQNYSSQDALNSLIGSPAGYIGCQHGELSQKIKKSKVGIVLFDEFEKATKPVFSFFLELLEEGKFTDSMAREYNLDGYILVFTSNILNEEEFRRIIPLELQTRFDLICEFLEPSYDDKTEFVKLLFKQAKVKFHEQFSQISLSNEDINELCNFNYSNLYALRDIKRLFLQNLIDFFSKKNII